MNPLKEEVQDSKGTKLLRYDLIAIDPDDGSELYENILLSTNELSEAYDYIKDTYIASNKLIYIHDHNDQTIKGIPRSLPKRPLHFLSGTKKH